MAEEVRALFRWIVSPTLLLASIAVQVNARGLRPNAFLWNARSGDTVGRADATSSSQGELLKNGLTFEENTSPSVGVEGDVLIPTFSGK